MNSYQTDVTVIIRSVGERTTQLCRKLVEEQVPNQNTFVINEIPFSETVRRTFCIGLEKDLPWTLAVDADILLTKNSIKTLISLAETEDKMVFKFNGRLLDKFFNFPRHGGPHLYRTELFEIALKYFPHEETIRPETAVLDELQNNTEIRSVLYQDIMGLHDYEQWYRDIYRKAFVHAHKHDKKFVEQLLNGWASFMADDSDFLVAVAGLCKGLAYQGDVSIDLNSLPMFFDENILTKGMQEKMDLITPSYNSCLDVEKYIDDIIFSRSHPFLSEFKLSSRNRLSMNIVSKFLGLLMEKTGRKIYSWASMDR